MVSFAKNSFLSFRSLAKLGKFLLQRVEISVFFLLMVFLAAGLSIFYVSAWKPLTTSSTEFSSFANTNGIPTYGTGELTVPAETLAQTLEMLEARDAVFRSPKSPEEFPDLFR